MVQYVRAKVTGEVPVRDVLTRESVDPGGEVTLLVRDPGDPRPRCPRHPKRGIHKPAERCYCSGSLVDALVEQGVIGDVKPFDPDGKPAKADGKA